MKLRNATLKLKATKDAYLTYDEWLKKHYNKTREELTEQEDEDLYDTYWKTTNEWAGISRY